MEPNRFVRELIALRDERIAAILQGDREPGPPGSGAEAVDLTRLLQVALSNEISASELAAAWMPSTPEIDVKIAFARQAGDEARHFALVQRRLRELGFDADAFAPPGPTPLFEYLRGLETTIERIAAGMFALEALAYGVNEAFMSACRSLGDTETVRIYRDYIQPDERAHQELGRSLLERYATTDERQELARAAVTRTLELAGEGRASAAAGLGTSRFPGC